jgi:hypothetical protein
MTRNGSIAMRPVTGAGHGGMRATWRRLAEWTRWATANRLVAMALFVSGGLKAYELATGPTFEGGLFSSRLLLSVLVDFEFFLAIWLASGLYGAGATVIALATFATFSIVSFVRILSSAESCGCFGPVKVHPAYSFALDVVLVIALCRSRIATEVHSRRAFRIRLSVAGGIFVCLAAPVTAAILNFRHDSFTSDGRIHPSGFAILEPKKWLGRSLPVLPYLDIEADLSRGDWVVVFHRHDCSKCAALMANWIRFAEQAKRRGNVPRVALVEVPPFADPVQLHVRPQPALSSGKLSDGVDWFIQTPTVIRVSGGTVVSIEDAESLMFAEKE